MSRSDKIAGILARRVRRADSLAETGSQLALTSGALTNLDGTRLALLGLLDDDAREALFALGKDIGELNDLVRATQENLRRVGIRLARPTLNVGMVGRARMGKSRFLQSLTRLTAREIPDGKSGFCTGVPSVIQHVTGADTTAQIYLHTQTTFVAEVIGPYFTELGLGSRPSSGQDFAARPLATLPRTDPTSVSAYGHLRNYHANFGAYGELLDRSSPFGIGADEIRRYVAQDNEDGTEEYHNFRAVRKVVISTAFRAPDVTGLAVVDLPGLGDTNLGDSKILLAALKDDVDVVLFMRQPSASGDDIQDFDVKLYDLAREALPEIPMPARSFMMINHRRSVDQDNLENARRFQAKLPASVIKVVDSAIVDCSSEQEVAAAFDPIVDYLVAHADELDGLLLADCGRQCQEIAVRLGRLVEAAGRLAAATQPSSAWFPLFESLFDKTFGRLSSSLEQHVQQLEKERSMPDGAFAEAVDTVVRYAAANDGIPSVEEIAERIAFVGGRSIAYGQLLNEARAQLSRHFLELDRALRSRVTQMQDDVARVLATDGELGVLSSASGRDFLLAVADRVPSLGPSHRESEIRYSLTMLAEFELAYRGFIQHRIRPCLDGIHGDHPTYPLGELAGSITARMLREVLQVTYQDALSQCQSRLYEILAEPNGALFAIVEEFRDRVLRSAGMLGEWRVFYENARVEIWAGPLAALAENSGQFEAWNHRVEELGACAQATLWRATATSDQGDHE